jgi:hypothetical protein
MGANKVDIKTIDTYVFWLPGGQPFPKLDELDLSAVPDGVDMTFGPLRDGLF